MDDLLKLAERCEKALGPDRQLDAEIARAIGFGSVRYVSMEATDYNNTVHSWIAWKSDKEVGPWEYLKAYTTSLDAALTLVPEGWAMRIEDWPRPEGQTDIASDGGPNAKAALMECTEKRIGRQVIWGWHTPGGASVEARAATPALALCAAALRSRASQ